MVFNCIDHIIFLIHILTLRMDIFGAKPPLTRISFEMPSKIQIAMGILAEISTLSKSHAIFHNPHSNLRFRGDFPLDLCVWGGFDPKMSLLISYSEFRKK